MKVVTVVQMLRARNQFKCRRLLQISRCKDLTANHWTGRREYAKGLTHAMSESGAHRIGFPASAACSQNLNI
jgi:hypothetical protein